MMRSPLLQMLVDKHGLQQITEENIDDFLAQHEYAVLFFTENPRYFPESNDVAVVLPELIQKFANRFTAAMVSEEAERNLMKRYAFNKWPALVFLREGQYLGVITGIHDWNEFCNEINTLLQAEPVKPPSFSIPVIAGAGTSCNPGK